MNFSDLQLNLPSDTIKLENGIQITKYLPLSDKLDLIQIALQKSEEDGIYNDILLDAYFHLNIIYLYTNLQFSQQEREDELALYDLLEANGIIDMVLIHMDENEYQVLENYIQQMKEEKLMYGNSAAAVLRSIIRDLPKNAAAAKEIVDSFDQSKYQEVINFATAANGGRNINTNAAPVDQETVPISPAANDKVVSIETAVKKD